MATEKRKLSSTDHPITFWMYDTDGVPVTGETVTVNLSKDGGAPGAASGAVSEIGSTGQYKLAGHATDRGTTGPLELICTSAGAETTRFTVDIVEYDPYLFPDVNLTKYLGTACPAADTAGYPKVTHKTGTGTGEISLTAGAVTLIPAECRVITSGTATAGGASTITLQFALGADDMCQGAMVHIYGGTGVGQSRRADSYVNGTQVLTVSRPWVVNPDNTSQYALTYADKVKTAAGGVIPWNAAWDSEVQSEVDDALRVLFLHHLFETAYDPASKPGHAEGLFNELIGDDAGVSQFTANALELGPTGGGGGTDWTADEKTALRTILGIPASGTTPDDPSAGILDTIRDAVAAVQTGVDDLPTNSELATALSGLATTAHVQEVEDKVDTVDTVADAIKAKTDNLPSDPADASDIAGAFSTVNGTLSTIAGYIDLEIATLQASVDAIPTNSELTTALSGLATTTHVQEVEDKVDIVDANVDTLLTRITVNLFNGITYLKNWLAMIAGKAVDAPTLAEINATTAGETYNNVTDSNEGQVDSGVGGISLDVGELRRFKLLINQPTEGLVVSDAGNTTSTFKTDLTGGPSMRLQAVIFADDAAVANARVTRSVLAHDTTTGFITVDEAFPAIPTAGDVIFFTGNQSRTS